MLGPSRSETLMSETSELHIPGEGPVAQSLLDPQNMLLDLKVDCKFEPKRKDFFFVEIQ